MGIIRIPNDFYSQFKTKPYESSRNILSIPLGALHPLFPNMDKVNSALHRELDNPFDTDSWTFDEEFYPDHYEYRYIHIDVGISHDCLGVSMVHVSDWKKVEINKKDAGLTIATLPVFKIDFLGKVYPAESRDIQISDIRELIIYELEDRGFPINLITYDGFGSIESVQILQDEGFNVGKLSLDRTTAYPIVDYSRDKNVKRQSTDQNYTAAWDCLYNAILQERVSIPFNSDFLYEAKHAEKKVKGNKVKIDSPSGAISLDLLESVAGSMFNAMNNEDFVQISKDEIETKEDKQDRGFYKQFEGDRNFDRLKNERDFSLRRKSNSANSKYDKYK